MSAINAAGADSTKRNGKKLNTGQADRFPSNLNLILFFLRGSLRYFFAGAVFACLVALFDLIIPSRRGDRR